MRGYIYFFTIACIITIIYCILITLFQLNVSLGILIFLLLLILTISITNKKIAHKMEDLEILFMLIILIFFAYALYKLYIPA